MSKNQQPNWHPISGLPLIGSMIDGMLQEDEEQYQTLQEVKPKPHVLDDSTVERVIRLYTSQSDYFPIYEEQLKRWKKTEITRAQEHEVNRLSDQLTKLRGVVRSILALAEELKTGTIDTILKKSDLELGLEVLLGKRKP